MDTKDICPTFDLHNNGKQVTLLFGGHWLIDQPCPTSATVIHDVTKLQPLKLQLSIADNFSWDSLFMARLYQIQQYCQKKTIDLDISALPEGAKQLLEVASAVAPTTHQRQQQSSFFYFSYMLKWFEHATREVQYFVQFIGEITIALSRLVRGKANTRWVDFWYFVQQAGPNAIGIISLTSVLIGMILAYLGLVQLRLFGAEIYIADLVTIGMVREMGALMTAIIMAGRTGAAYAAQLGTMQGNEEIDAITTLGMSPIEFLVLPRMLALICIMPLLCLFSDMLGMVGGAIVSMGMDITFNQYIAQTRDAIDGVDVLTGLFKSLVFAVLIAIAGCKAGIQSGRDSAAVGEATTKAVVTALVYLVIADAALNIIYDKMGI